MNRGGKVQERNTKKEMGRRRRCCSLLSYHTLKIENYQYVTSLKPWHRQAEEESIKEEKSKYVYILFMYWVTFSICWHKFKYFFNTLANQNVGLLSTISSKPFTLCELKYNISQIGLLCNMISFIAGQSVAVYHLQFNIRMSFTRLLRSSFLPRSL